MNYPLAAIILQLVNQLTDPNPYLLRAKILSSPYISFRAGMEPDDIMAFQEAAGVELLDREALAAYSKPGSCRLDFTFVNRIRQEAFRTVKPSPGTHVLDVVRRYVKEYPELYKNTFSHEEPCLGDILVQFYLLSRAEKAMASFPARMTVSEFAGAMRGLIALFQIEANAGRDCGSLPEYREFRNRDLVLLSRLNALIGEITVSFAPFGDAGGKYPLAELTRYFSALLGEAVLYREEYAGAKQDSMVSVQPACSGQFRDWSHTFVCGLVDGEFPAAEKYNFLEPVKDGLRLGHSYTGVDYGRNWFYQLVRTTTTDLFLSRPLSDNGKQLPPSPFILEAGKHVPPSPAGLHRDDPPVPRDGKEAARDRNLPVFYSRREELLFLSKNADREADRFRPLLEKLKKEDEAFYTRITGILRYDGLTQNAKFSEFDGLLYSTGDGASYKADAPCAAEMPDTVVAEEIEKITFTSGVLERYAACPMRFFFDDILHLRQKPDYDPDASDAGRLIRSLLREYAEEAAACGGVPDNARFLFRKALEKQEEKEGKTDYDAFQTRFIRSLTAGLDNRDARPRGTLAAFLEYEENGPDRLSPYRGRVAGTVSPGDGPDIEVEADRVDVAPHLGYLFPFLHTASKTGDPNGIRRGLCFDLPLVIMLLMDMVKEKGLDLTVGGAGYYLVKNAKNVKRTGYMAVGDIRAPRRNQVSEERPVFSGSKDGFFEEDTFLKALDACVAHILRLYGLMRKGTFHLPLCLVSEQSCQSCSFSRLCRKEQLRLDKIRRDAANGDKILDRLHTVAEIF